MHTEQFPATSGRTPSPLRDHDWTINGPIPEPQRVPEEPGWRQPHRPGVPGRRRRRGPQDRRVPFPPIPNPPPEVRCWLI